MKKLVLVLSFLTITTLGFSQTSLNKLHPSLKALYSSWEKGQTNLTGQFVSVSIVINGNAKAALKALQSLGFKEKEIKATKFKGILPVPSLERASAVSLVGFILPAPKPRPDISKIRRRG